MFSHCIAFLCLLRLRTFIKQIIKVSFFVHLNSVIFRAEFRSRFRVQYVATFTDEHYVYWVTVQNKDVKGTSPVNPMVSKLVRVCRNDDK